MSTIIPNTSHTIFMFNLPFPIPVPDGIYEVKNGLKIAKIAIKRIQRKKPKNIQYLRFILSYICKFFSNSV